MWRWPRRRCDRSGGSGGRVGRRGTEMRAARRAVKARWAAVRGEEEGRLALRVPLRVVLTSRGGNPQSDWEYFPGVTCSESQRVVNVAGLEVLLPLQRRIRWQRHVRSCPLVGVPWTRRG